MRRGSDSHLRPADRMLGWLVAPRAMLDIRRLRRENARLDDNVARINARAAALERDIAAHRAHRDER